jgi:hypothetical protein
MKGVLLIYELSTCLLMVRISVYFIFYLFALFFYQLSLNLTVLIILLSPVFISFLLLEVLYNFSISGL